MHLRVAASEWLPWVWLTYKNGSIDSIRGVLGQLLEDIVKATGISYSLSEPADNEWGVLLRNGSFSGMIGMLHRNESDMAIGPFSPGLGRDRVAQFTNVLFDDFATILSTKTHNRLDIEAIGGLSIFFTMFEFPTWLLLLLSVLALNIVFVLSHVLAKEGKTAKLKLKNNKTLIFHLLARYFFAIVGNLLRQESRLFNGFKAKPITWWLIISSWFLSSVTVSNLFGSTLSGEFVTVNTKAIENFEELVPQTSLLITTEKGTSTFQDGSSEAIEIIYQRVHETESLSFLKAQDLFSKSNMDLVYSGHNVVIAEEVTLKYILLQYTDSIRKLCKFHVSSQGFPRVKYGMLMTKQLPARFTEQINLKIMQYLEADLFQRVLSNFSRLEACDSAKSLLREAWKPATFSALRGVFYILFFGSSLACVGLLCEFAFRWFPRKRRPRLTHKLRRRRLELLQLHGNHVHNNIYYQCNLLYQTIPKP